MSGSGLFAALGVIAAAWGAWRALDRYQLREEARYEHGVSGPSVAARLRSEREELSQLSLELATRRAAVAPVPKGNVIVVSISDRKLELRQGPKVGHVARAAVGMGVVVIDGEKWFFDTPIGTLKVIAKEKAPLWVPPDWHYLEMAHKGKGKVVELRRGRPYTLRDGRQVEIVGDDVGFRDSSGSFTPAPPSKDVWDGDLIFMPPTNTNQRRFTEVLGSHRLKLTDGFGVHGTNKPESVGRATSHGCIRLANPDIDAIYDEVQVGSRVMIY